MKESLVYQEKVGERTLRLETQKLAVQADAAVTVRYGDTVVLVTVCVSNQQREGVDFLPLTIDYEERLYAAGKIPGGFIRREGRPSEEATLTSRLTDRPLRPLLPKAWRNDIQVIATVLSADQENDPNLLAVIGGSAVLNASEVPFDGPVSAISIGRIDGKLVLNPTMVQMEESTLDLIVISSKDALVMVEGEANELPEAMIIEAIKMGHEANQAVIKLQDQIRQDCGKPKVEASIDEVHAELAQAIAPILEGRLAQALGHADKLKRDEETGALKQECLDKLMETFPEADIKAAFNKALRTELRSAVLDKGIRVGGRGVTDIRDISCEVGILPRTHGSGLFNRGQTQVLAITTLGPTRKRQQLDGLGIEETKRFIHHYNFPPFSVGEVRRVGSPGRREIGHGALAGRALVPTLPDEEKFPYTIRLVSEVLSSNGSTSMASVCASSLSLMDAGVPLSRAVAGIAMGLVTDETGKFVVLTDLEGIEDAHGDMDFKVAGTTEGITSMQFDIKIKGLSLEIIEAALKQAREARLEILEKMNQVIPSSRTEMSPYAPRIYRLTIAPDKIGALIGPGGKNIRGITEETTATVDVDNDGTVLIGSPDEESARRAIKMVEDLTKDVEVGCIYTGKVSRILNFGAMVEVLPGKEGLVHISELADYRVANVTDEVNLGDEVTVKAIGIDDMGRVNLSRRAVFEDDPEKAAARQREQAAKRPPRPRHDSSQGHGRPPHKRPYHKRG